MFYLELKWDKIYPQIYHPDYPEDDPLNKPSPNELFANIELNIKDKSGNKITTLLHITWDIICLLRWIFENHEKLLKDNEPTIIFNKGSLSHAIKVFYTNLPDEDNNNNNTDLDSILETLYKYRTHHGFQFAMRGTDIPDIYIGKNNEAYEISCADTNNCWRYEIDFPVFFDQLKKKCQKEFSKHHLNIIHTSPDCSEASDAA